MKLALTLHDDCARYALRMVARRYALLSIQSRLTDAAGTANAPWFRTEGLKLLDRYARWQRETDRARAAFKRTLAGLPNVTDDLLVVPEGAIVPYESKHARVLYQSDIALQMADAFADRLCAAVFRGLK